MYKQFCDKFKEKLQLIQMDLTEEQMKQFYDYYELLVEWNKVMNLTAITEMDEVIVKHFIDSLSLNRLMSNLSENDIKLIDVGTGAGFPGIPLKIAFPNIHITLLDSLNKRINFLNEVIQKLGLENIEALHGRAEDFGRNPEYRECYDLVVSRAVANLSSLSEYCLPFVKTGGFFIPYKSGNIEEELQNAKGAVKLLGAKIEGVENFALAETDIERSFVKIKKIEKTAKKYPRKSGMPTKEPLK